MSTSSENKTIPDELQFEELVFRSPEEAARVLAELLKTARRNKTTSVAHFHDLCGVLGHYTDLKWVWTENQLRSNYHRRRRRWLFAQPAPAMRLLTRRSKMLYFQLLLHLILLSIL